MFKFFFISLVCLIPLRLAFLSQPLFIGKSSQKKVLLDSTQPLFFSGDTLFFYKKNSFASYYHSKFEGRKTANDELFSNTQLTAAHRTLAFGTLLKITNVANNKSVVVKVNDRGPFSRTKEIDLSQAAFLALTSSLSVGRIVVNIQELN